MARKSREPLTKTQRKVRVWVAAVVAFLIVAIAVTGISVASVTTPGQGDLPVSTEAIPSEAYVPSNSPDAIVDPSVTSRGWLPEPVTEDPRAYGEQAAIALATYDTTLATRADLIGYLATWHTIDTRLSSDADQQSTLKTGIQVIGQWMIPPVNTWDEQALTKTALTAKVVGSKMDEELLAFANDPPSTDGQHIVTSEIAVTTSEEDRSTGQRNQFDQRFTITVRIMCGKAVPPVGSKGSPPRCMILNYINDPIL